MAQRSLTRVNGNGTWAGQLTHLTAPETEAAQVLGIQQPQDIPDADWSTHLKTCQE